MSCTPVASVSLVSLLHVSLLHQSLYCMYLYCISVSSVSIACICIASQCLCQCLYCKSKVSVCIVSLLYLYCISVSISCIQCLYCKYYIKETERELILRQQPRQEEGDQNRKLYQKTIVLTFQDTWESTMTPASWPKFSELSLSFQMTVQKDYRANSWAYLLAPWLQRADQNSEKSICRLNSLHKREREREFSKTATQRGKGRSE